MATARLPNLSFFLRQSFPGCPYASRRCPQCLRPFSSTRCQRQSTKRQLMTESAYRSPTIDPPPPPARAADVPNTSITSDLSQRRNPFTSSPCSSSAASTSDQRQPIPQVSEQVAQQPRPVATDSATATTAPTTAAPTTKPRRRTLKAQKAAMTLTPAAVERLRDLLDDPEPKLIRVGVKNKGCSGSAYHLEYVDKPAKFDEQVEQDGVKVLIDSRALLKVIGSEMDWVEDKLSARFTFRNPNITEQCGCGESFSIG